MKYFFEKNRLVIQGKYGEKVLSLDRNINQVVAYDDNVFVLWHDLGQSHDPKGNQNILCVNEKGETVWVVEDPDEYEKRCHGRKKKTYSPFMNIFFDNDRGTLVACNWRDTNYDVDPETGKIVADKWVK